MYPSEKFSEEKILFGVNLFKKNATNIIEAPLMIF